MHGVDATGKGTLLSICMLRKHDVGVRRAATWGRAEKSLRLCTACRCVPLIEISGCAGAASGSRDTPGAASESLAKARGSGVSWAEIGI